MRLIDIATERRVTVVMFTVAIVLFGFVSLSRLRVNLLPDLSYPTLEEGLRGLRSPPSA